MKEFTVIIMFLLFFEPRSNFGHTLSKIQLNNLSDTYKVTEGNSSLTITSPKANKQTLREIIYYHIIEKPYKEHQVDNNNKIDTGIPDVDIENDDKRDGGMPDVDITRSFTNGHGYQFIEGDDDNTKTVSLDGIPEIDERMASDELIDDINDEELDDDQVGIDDDNDQELGGGDVTDDVEVTTVKIDKKQLETTQVISEEETKHLESTRRFNRTRKEGKET